MKITNIFSGHGGKFLLPSYTMIDEENSIQTSIDSFVNQLVYGTVFTIRNSRETNLKKRFFFLNEEDNSKLQYFSDNKGLDTSYIDLKTIDNIFVIQDQQQQYEIRIQTERRSFIFVFAKETYKTQLLCGFRYLAKEASGSIVSINTLSSINNVSSNYKKKGTLFLQGGDEKDNFELFMNDTHTRLFFHNVYQSFCYELYIPMYGQQFQKFWFEVQREALVGQEILNMIQKSGETLQQFIPFKLFAKLLLQESNSIFDKKFLKIYQSMDEPLTHYYVCSSHNTYLEGDQLTSTSSTLAYINALEKGARCIEIDTWDGPNGEPIVYHGHTLTSKIKFKSVIQTLAIYAFKWSEFPLIISIENHCTFEQQGRMADIIRKELWEVDNQGQKKFLVYTIPIDIEITCQFPSPNELKRCILLKDKGKLQAVIDRLKQKSEQQLNLSESNIQQEKTGLYYAIQQIGQLFEKIDLNKSNLKSSKSLNEDEQKYRKETHKPTSQDRHQQYEDLICLFGIPFNPKIIERTFWNISSFDEYKIKDIIQQDEKAVLDFHRYFFSRIYPSGHRVNSSNYDPFPALVHGSQLVALNFQTLDEHLFALLGKFQENGGVSSGYILKPMYMRQDIMSETKKVDIVPKTLLIQIISGYHLIDDREVDDFFQISPQVLVYIRGSSIDESKNQIFKTKIKSKNALNPYFNSQVYSFRLQNPEHTLLFFEVIDNETNTRICWYSLPLHCVRQGYRIVPLRDKYFKFLNGTYLLVKVDIQ